MQPTANLWQLLCNDLHQQRMSVSRADFVRVADQFVVDAARVLRSGSERLADAREIAGDICAEAGDATAAVRHYREAYSLVTDLEIRHFAAARLAAKLADKLNDTGQPEQARIFCQRALEHFEYCDDHSQHTNLLNLRASLERMAGEPLSAIKSYSEAISVVEKLHGSGHQDLAVLYNNMGVAWIEAGEYGSAEKALLQALGLREQIFGATHPEVAHSLTNLGVLHHSRGDAPQASRFYTAALDIYRHFLAPDAEEICLLEENLRQLERR